MKAPTHPSCPRPSWVAPVQAAMLALLVLPLTGCVQRMVTITSEPAGALVHLNDREVGRTPVEVPFTYYGTYDVRLDRDGYEPLWTATEAKAPWWETPPLDLLAELSDNRVELHWHYDLEPAQATDDAGIDELVDHAKQMRARVETE